MKKIIYTILITISFISIAESKEINEIQERDGLIYEVNTKKPFTGKLVTYWDNGQKKHESNIKKGILHGYTITWWENGQMWEKQNWKNGKSMGVWTWWHENGKKMLEGKVSNNTERDGVWTWWDTDGNIEKTETYKNGILVE